MKFLLFAILSMGMGLQSNGENNTPEIHLKITGLLGGEILTNHYTPTTWEEIRNGKIPKVNQQIVIEGVFAHDPDRSDKYTFIAFWDKDQWEQVISGKAEGQLRFLYIPIVYQETLKKQFRTSEHIRVYGVINKAPDTQGELIRIDAVKKS